ncbi:MAG: DUF4129 domain-containing protein [Gammaproteobacteria bacterium]
MKLEDVAVTLRQRSPWEAIDLGFTMVRQWWRTIYAPLLTIVIPFFLILSVAFRESLWVAAVLLWWFKPLYDRIVLHVVSRSLFGNTPSCRETLAAIPGMLRPGLLTQLTIFRLDPARSFNLPVWQLEQQKGRRGSERRQILHRQGYGPAVWLLLTCFHLELVITVTIFGMIYLMLPANVEIDWAGLFFGRAESGLWLELASNASYLLTIIVIEPLYVAAGFALYINRRTSLEGWDIELNFRRMAQRLADTKIPAVVASTVLILGLVLTASGFSPVTVYADETPINAERLTADDAARVIEEVLAAEDFQEYVDQPTWRLKNQDDESEPEPGAWPRSFLPGMLAPVAVALMWLALLGALLYIFVQRDKWQYVFTRTVRRPDTYEPPAKVLGLDITPESLPDDIAGEALALWQAGKVRQAVSLLYRGSLMVLTNRQRLEVHASHTEGDILTIAGQHLDKPSLEYQTRLTRCWQTVAYAHREPDARQGQDLCARWRKHFGGEAA